MSEESRPLLYYGDDQDQHAQGMLLEDTGDGKSADNEEEVLGQSFGPPNSDGIYGAPEAPEAPEGSDN